MTNGMKFKRFCAGLYLSHDGKWEILSFKFGWLFRSTTDMYCCSDPYPTKWECVRALLATLASEEAQADIA